MLSEAKHLVGEILRYAQDDAIIFFEL